MELLSKNQKIIAIIGIIIVIGVIIFYYINSTKDLYSYEEVNDLVEAEEVLDDETNNIVVHITGAVKNNGVVEVKENARINDVIEAAGGTTEDADLTNVNLAYVVEDGQKIYIPSISDTNNVSSEEIIDDEAGENVIDENNSNSSSSTLININTASQSQLEELPGIGTSTANKIITYREENGKFKTIEDIKNVSRYRR